jgi:hypothetical protein
MTRSGNLFKKATYILAIFVFLLLLPGCYQPKKDFYRFNGESALEVHAPSGQIKLFFEAFPQKGILFSINYKGRNILEPSRLGLTNIQNKPFLAQPEIEKVIGRLFREQQAGEAADAHSYNEMAIYLRSKEVPDRRMKILVRLYRNNIMAFRYEVLSGLSENIDINGELTEFILPKGRKNNFFSGMKGENPVQPDTHIDFPVWFSSRNAWVRIADTEETPTASLRKTGDFTLDIISETGTVINFFPFPFPWREITIADSKQAIINTENSPSLKYRAR